MNVIWTGLLICILSTTALVGYTSASDDPDGREIQILYFATLESMVSEFIELFHSTNPEILVTAASVNNTTEILSDITAKGIEADVIIVADYPGLEKKMVPSYSDWYIRYGNCAMVLCYAHDSPYAQTITSENWFEILEKENATVAVLHPGSDDARGWRCLISMDLADAYYNKSVFSRLVPPETGISRVVAENGTIITATDVHNTSNIQFFSSPGEMSQSIKNGSVDFGWHYRGGAYKAGLQILDLPDEINLGYSRYADTYSNITVQTGTGNKKSPPIVFAATIPIDADNQKDGALFIRTILSSEGQKILSDHGQFPISPPELVYYSPEPHMDDVLSGIEFTLIPGNAT